MEGQLVGSHYHFGEQSGHLEHLVGGNFQVGDGEQHVQLRQHLVQHLARFSGFFI